jgi:hypothetical protein
MIWSQMNDYRLLPLVLLPAGLANTLRQVANESMGVWDYVMNGGFITIVVVLWVALRR